MKNNNSIFSNKKAMFFTLLTISLISLFILAFAMYFFTEDRKALNNRVQSMNNFVFSLEDDLSRQLYISGYRAIFLIEKRISENGVPINNLSDVFQEIFYNCSIYGEPQNSLYCLTFNDIFNSMIEKGNKINVRVSFFSDSIKIVQDDPWKLKLILHGQLFIDDNGKLASWNKTGEFYSYLSIEGFEDPLYSLSTGGKVLRRINKTSYLPFVSGTNVTNLSRYLSEKQYIGSVLALSFIDRLEGKNSPSFYGIESLVSLPELTAQGITVEDKSIVDYIYFSYNNPNSYSVSGMPSWFKLDGSHINSYGAGGLI